MTMQSVNLARYPLTGVSLIEASAGTGKTYTITHLYVRYLLETDYQVNQLLIVTFTNAATQELRGRIRELVYQVSLYLQQDAGVAAEFDELFKSWQGNADALFKLQRALINFDEAAIYSIHGFCQRLLSVFPLETQSLLQQKIISNEKELQQQAVRDFWRKKIVGCERKRLEWILQHWKQPDDLLQELYPLFGFVESLQQTVQSDANYQQQGTSKNSDFFVSARKHRTENRSVYDIHEDSSTELTPQSRKKTILRGAQQINSQWSELCTLWAQTHTEIKAVLLDNPNLNKRSYAAATVTQLFEQLDSIFQQTLPYALPAKWELITQTKLLNSLLKNKQDERLHWPFFSIAESFSQSHKNQLRQMKLELLADATGYVLETIRQQKAQAQNLSFDDLIECVGAAVNEENIQFNDQITRLFPIAMVDEFQDTDSQQYRIFKTLYQHRPDSALIMIGDPKQAIYSFRGADVFTYQRARKSTRAQFTLDTNYRSSSDYVAMLNQLFSCHDNAFVFPELIQFHNARANPHKQLTLTQHQQILPALVSWIYPFTDKPAKKASANDYFATLCADEIQHLLNQQTLMLNEQPVTAKDLAILVKTGYQASLMKNKLAERGIASAMIQRDSVFSSQQAMDISQLLAVLINPGNSALLFGLLASDLFSWNSQDIYHLQQQDHKLVTLLEAMKAYQLHWQQHGILSMFFRLIEDQQSLQKNIHFADGERRLTNWMHIMELLQEQASQHASQSQALHWLNRQIEDSANMLENEAHQLRLESDSRLVRIVTVHKSKGLQYPIVFLPFMWNVKEQTKAPGSYSYHDEQGYKKIMLEDDAQIERWRQEKLAEEIRLFYVAITRAQYRCYMGWGNIRGAQDSAITHVLYNGELTAHNRDEFLTPFKQINQISQHHPIIELRLDDTDRHSDESIKTRDQVEAIIPARKFQRSIQQQWRISSYSQIASSTAHEQTVHRPDYDSVTINTDELIAESEQLNRFTFYKGATAGNFLHNLLEDQVFDQTIDEKLISSKLKEYGFNRDWQPVLKQWLQDILQTCLGPLKLADLAPEQKLCEMEFYMTSHRLNQQGLNDLLHQHDYLLPHQSYTFSKLNGFLKGFIDLIFEHQGQYFVADYKSNYLGADFADYAQDSCRQAMYQHHYHLQYLIYTLALHRYLKQRLPGYQYQQHIGGVYYLFLRGMTPQQTAKGIYFDRPDSAVIQQLDELFD